MFRKNAVAWFAVALAAASFFYHSGSSRPVTAVAPQLTDEVKTAKALSSAFNNVATFVHESVVQISAEGRRAPMRGNSGNRRANPNVPNMPFPGMPGGPGGGNGGQQLTPEQFEELMKKFFEDGPFRFRQNSLTQNPGQGTGSGFVFDRNGHIVTNNHVVEGAETIKVRFHDGETLTAKVVGRDPMSDIAVIKVEGSDYRPLELGDSENLKVGELVMAVGSPFGLTSTYTIGIVSATHRNDLGIVGQRGYEDFIQTDAAINPGNSGGPLVDMNGRVVGVNSAIVSGSRGNDGVGFAIPIDMASKLAEKIIRNGKVERAMMGINLGELTPATARQFGLDPKTSGALVQDVVEGSPAEKAGLRSGDIITKFDDKGFASWLDLRNRVAVSDIGKPYDVTYVRGGREVKGQVVLASADSIAPGDSGRENQSEEPALEKAKGTSFAQFGLILQDLDKELADKLGYGPSAKGLVIAAVKEGSPAEEVGLEQGLLISKIVKDKVPVAVTTVKDFEAIADKANELTVFVQSPRGGPVRYVTLTQEK
jgi:serine protease Do